MFTGVGSGQICQLLSEGGYCLSGWILLFGMATNYNGNNLSRVTKRTSIINWRTQFSWKINNFKNTTHSDSGGNEDLFTCRSDNAQAISESMGK